MSDIVWQDPPPSKTAAGAGRWTPIFAALREHPGQWALVQSGDNRPGGLTTMARRHGIQVTIRTRPDGTFDTYMRAPEDES